jgi:Flp pilus assembly protein TadG
MMRALFRRLRTDRRGVTAVEFAIVAPVMCMLLMGLCDLAYQSYVQSILTGAIQKAGRDSTIQGATNKTGAIDAAVMKMVKSVAKNASYTSSRKSYASFSNIKPEAFQDNNSNSSFDAATECFTDVNGNNTWDIDPGITGQGGANDVVLYTIEVSYPRLFPLYGLLGLPGVQKLGATTILKNQPYAQQNVYAAKQVCPA